MKQLVAPEFASTESFAEIGIFDLTEVLIKVSSLTILVVLSLIAMKGII